MILYGLVAFGDDAIHRRVGVLRLRQGGVSIMHVRQALTLGRVGHDNRRVRVLFQHPVKDVADVIGNWLTQALEVAINRDHPLPELGEGPRKSG